MTKKRRAASHSDAILNSGFARNVRSVRRNLIEWGSIHFRSFPWRLSQDPYAILIAEVMLHRTQARQVIPVYQQFIERYPDVATLFTASKEELRQILYPLGLHWRTDLMHAMASQLMLRFEGHIPRKKEDLLSLPGVSEYIASAVRCFAWNEPDALIDTNTVRVTGRVFGLEVKDSSRRNRLFRELITALMDPHKPRAYNYALLDLADQVCTKKRPPDCPKCPLQKYCLYGQSGRTNARMLSNSRLPDG